MIILDSLLFGGIKFVLGKIADAVEAELDDEGTLREQLLAAQMQLELGELGEKEYAGIEREILARLREIRERQLGESPSPGEIKIAGVETTFEE